MATNMTAAAAAAAKGDPVPAPPGILPAGRLPAVRRRRRPAVVVLAVLLVGLGALVNAAALGQRGRVGVLAVARPVSVGQQITDADLRVVQLSPDAGLSPVPADQQASVVGRYAAVGLQPGTLLTATAVIDHRAPAAGQALLAVAAKSGLVPARGLTAGDQVLLVPVAGDQAGSQTPGSAAPSPVQAVVADVGQPDPNAMWTVDVAVEAADAPGLADAAAAGRLAILLLPAGS